MRRIVTPALRILIPIALVAAGVGGAFTMLKSTESADVEPVAPSPALVDVIAVEAEARRPTLSGTGVIEPSRQVAVTPEVGGRVIFQSDNLVVGGRFAAGEVMVRIDARDYKIAVRQQKNMLEQARLELEIEQGRGNVARREWEMLSQRADSPDSERGRLARREPYAEAVEVGVDAAKSGLDKARLDLERTVVQAPFASTVLSESTEVGQFVGNATVLATLVGTDQVWARISLPVEYLRLIEIPGPSGEPGSKAQVIQTLRNGATITWEGRVIRLIKELDSDSRTAQLLVAVDDPFDPAPGQLPLLPGAFVRVDLTGELVPEVVRVPRRAVVEGRYAWVVNERGTLERRGLDVGWSDDEAVYATAGLTRGDRVVLDPPSVAIADMPVRAREVSLTTPRTADAGAKAKTEG